MSVFMSSPFINTLVDEFEFEFEDEPVISAEEEDAMAWVEDQMEAMEAPDMETEVCDVFESGLTWDDLTDQVSALYPQGIPDHIKSDLLSRMMQREAPRGFSHMSFYIPSIINSTLTSMEPEWFDARRTMPDINDHVMRLVIGRGGCGLKRFQSTHGALFLWYNRETLMMHIWGFTPSNDGKMSVMDIEFNLRSDIINQTKRRHAVALERLYRSTARRRDARIGRGIRVTFD